MMHAGIKKPDSFLDFQKTVRLCFICLPGRALFHGVQQQAETSVKHIIWITGMGIHHEIGGVHGIMLNMLAKQRRQ